MKPLHGLGWPPLLTMLLWPLVGLADPASGVSFSRQVLPIMMKECSFCHMREERYGYLVIDPESAYGNLVGIPAHGYPAMQRVVPGAPERSYLWLKLRGEHLALGAEGWPMPFFPLAGPDMELIRQWIEQGAADN